MRLCMLICLQSLDEYEKQLLYEENQKSENVMQQPMNSCVFGMNTSSLVAVIGHLVTVSLRFVDFLVIIIIGSQRKNPSG